MAKTKGAHVLNAVKALKSSREQALRVLPPALHHYLTDRILPSSWYPMEEHLGLLRAIATMMPPGQDPWPLMGQGTARMDLSGIYKAFVRKGEVLQTMHSMAAVWRSVHDTGEVSTSSDGPGRFTLTMRGYAMRAPEICGIATGYLGEVVAIASDGKRAKVEHASCRCRGADECVWLVTWPER